MRLTKTQQAEKLEAATKLREWLPPGATVYTVVRHVSKSGMSRRIDLYTWIDGDKMFLSGYVGCVLDMRRPYNKDGLKVDGCGMDMGFHVVYSLSYALWGKAFKCIGVNGKAHKDRCPSNDHHDYGWKGRKGTLHSDGGYALRQEWI